MRAGIEPGIATAHALDIEVATLQVDPVDVGDLEFAADRWLDRLRNFDHIGVVEIEAGDGPVRFWLLGLLLDGRGHALLVEGHDAITLGVGDMIGEDRRALLARDCGFALLLQLVAVEDVVAQHQCAGATLQKLFADQEGLRETARIRLLRIFQIDAENRTVSQHIAEMRQVMRGGNDQDVLQSRQHQDRQRIVDHRLVVDGKELFRDGECQGIEARSASPRQDNSTHQKSSMQLVLRQSWGCQTNSIATPPEVRPRPHARTPYLM